MSVAVKGVTVLLDEAGILQLLKEFALKLAEQIEKIYDAVVEAKHSELRKSISVSSLKDSVMELLSKARKFFDAIDDLFYYCMDEDFDPIKTSFLNGDGKLLCGFVARMADYLRFICEAHQQFNESCDDVKRQCEEAGDNCAKFQAKQSTRKKATRIGGGIVTATTLVGGVGASVVAGVFTFGIGTVVGLAATAGVVAATGAAGTGSATITHLTSKHFKKSEEAFRRYGSNFASLKVYCSGVASHVRDAQLTVDRFKRSHSSLEIADSHNKRSLCTTLDRLKSIAKENRPETWKLVKTLDKYKEKVSNI